MGFSATLPNTRSNFSRPRSDSSVPSSRAMSMNRFDSAGSSDWGFGLRGMSSAYHKIGLSTEAALRLPREVARTRANAVRVGVAGTYVLPLHLEDVRHPLRQDRELGVGLRRRNRGRRGDQDCNHKQANGS